jgi:hypothetical protein
LPIWRATSAAWLVMPAARGQDPGRGLHAADVLGRGLDAHEHHARSLARSSARAR